MSRDRDPLTPEERALAEALARALPRGGPPPEVDAAVLASARRAAAPGRRRSRGRWPAMLGVAASLALAAGVAWQLRPMPERPLPAASEVPAASATTSGPPAAPRRSAPLTPQSADGPPPAPDEQMHSRAAPPPVAESAPTAPARDPPARPAPARESQAMPAPPSPTVRESTAAPRSRGDDADAGGRHSAQPPPAAETAIGRKAVRADSASRAAPLRTLGRSTVAAPAPAAAEDHGGDIVFGQELHEDPPATVDSPQIHRAWLERIRELRKAGETDAARASLREYRRRYPGHTLPDDLEDLLRE